MNFNRSDKKAAANLYEQVILDFMEMTELEIMEMLRRYKKTEEKFYSDIFRIIDDFNRSFKGHYCYVIEPVLLTGPEKTLKQRIHKINLIKNRDPDPPSAKLVFETAKKAGITFYDYLLKTGYL